MSAKSTSWVKRGRWACSLIAFGGVVVTIVAATACLFVGGVPPLALKLIESGLVIALTSVVMRGIWPLLDDRASVMVAALASGICLAVLAVLVLVAIWSQERPADPWSGINLGLSVLIVPTGALVAAAYLGRVTRRALPARAREGGVISWYALASIVSLGWVTACLFWMEDVHHYYARLRPTEESIVSVSSTLQFQLLQLTDERRLGLAQFITAAEASVSAFPASRLLECHYYYRDQMSPHQLLAPHVCTLATLDDDLLRQLDPQQDYFSLRPSYQAPVTIQSQTELEALFAARPKYQAQIFYNLLDEHDAVLDVLKPEMVLSDEPGRLQVYWREASTEAIEMGLEELVRDAEKYRLGTTVVDVYWQ